MHVIMNNFDLSFIEWTSYYHFPLCLNLRITMAIDKGLSVRSAPKHEVIVISSEVSKRGSCAAPLYLKQIVKVAVFFETCYYATSKQPQYMSRILQEFIYFYNFVRRCCATGRNATGRNLLNHVLNKWTFLPKLIFSFIKLLRL